MSSASEIALKIFEGSPKSPGSISFGINDEMDLKEIFEMLLMVFTEGMKIRHGDENDKVDLNSLREADFQKFQAYFVSFGFNCLYRIYKPTQQVGVDFEARKYTNLTIARTTKLEALRLPLKCGPRIFEISFSFYQPLTTCHQEMGH